MEPQPTVFVRFLRTHPAFGYFVGQVGEVLKHVGEVLIADGFAEPATELTNETATAPADEHAAPLPTNETATVPTDEYR